MRPAASAGTTRRGGLRLGRMALAAGAIVVLCSACAPPPPVQEMSDARQTIAAARAAGAVRCAAAEEATVAAHRWIENASYALRIHDYRMAERSALRARRRAYEALVMLHVVPPRRGMPSRLVHLCPPPRAKGKGSGSGPKP